MINDVLFFWNLLTKNIIKLILYVLSNDNISVKILIVIFFAILAGQYFSLSLKSGFYTISLILEEVLIFTMPFIIFSFLFSCITSFKKQSLIFVIILFCSICVSNFISTILAYIFGILTLPYVNITFQAIKPTLKPLAPLWTLKLPHMISSEYALLVALGLGIIFSIYPSSYVNYAAQKLKTMVALFLEKVFTPLLPIFIFGFILKMQHEGALIVVIQEYGTIFILIIFLCFFYLITLYFLSANFNLKKAFTYFKNVIPSGIMGFTTISSIATMPITLRAAEKNTKNPLVVETVIPFTVNIHLIGDSLAIPVMALAILLSFGKSFPLFDQYIIFALYFALCRLAVAAIPGGGILMILPILERYLEFSAEMSVLITTLFILFDPFATAVNVVGNGGFTILANKFFTKQPMRGTKYSNENCD